MAPPTATATQKQILAAIQALSDRMDRQGIVSAASIETRFDAQDKMSGLEAAGRIAPILVRLDSIDRNVAGLKDQLTVLNGTVRAHDKEIGQLRVFCEEQVKPALGKVTDIRIELAKLVAQGSGIGLILAILAGIAKAAGWW